MNNISSKNRLSQGKLGFSLIELSIVILVIGILVIGITQGSRIIRESKLKSARALTTSSPVASTSGLIIWIESTSEKSFADSEEVDTTLGTTGTISTWNDINPQASTQNSPTQGVTADKPRYIASGINGLPSINFDGVSDFMNFDGSALANNNYTVIAVEQRRSATAPMYFIGGSGITLNTRFHAGYFTNTAPAFRQYSNDFDALGAVGGYTSPIPRIHMFVFNSNSGKKYYLNGTDTTLTNTGGGVATNGLTSNAGAIIGKVGPENLHFNGDIGEIIIFNKTLNNLERTSIESYLESKWSIK